MSIKNMINRYNTGIITGKFMDERIGYGYAQGSLHEGEDLLKNKGNKAFSEMDGVVTNVLDDPLTYGKHVIIVTNMSPYNNQLKGIEVAQLFGHLFSTKVKEGDIVTKGQVIGLTGNSGNCWYYNKDIKTIERVSKKEQDDISCSNGAHLHYSISTFYTNNILPLFIKKRLGLGNAKYFFTQWNRIWFHPNYFIMFLRSFEYELMKV